MHSYSGQSSERRRGSTLNALFFEALNERNHFTLFRVWHLKLRESLGGVPKEHIPITFTDAHAFVSKRHVSAAIVHWATRARAKEVNEKLLLTHYAVLSTMRPKATELRIRPKSRQEIICYRRDSVISAKALVKGLRLVAHCFLSQTN
jgi:hypothetical protein